MERHLVTNNLQSAREFSGLNRLRVELLPGSNWLTEEELKFLENNSGGFQHFLKLKDFVIEDQVRDETPKEKTLRLKIMEKGKALLNKMKPQGKDDTSPALDTEKELETFKSALQSSADAIFETFAKSLTEEKSASLEAHLKEFTESMNEIVERYKLMLTQSLEAYEKKLRSAEDSSYQKYDVEMKAVTTPFFETLSKNLDKIIKSKAKSFGKQLDTIVLQKIQKQK